MTATTVPMSIRLDVTAREELKAMAARQKSTAHARATEAINQFIAQKARGYAWHESGDAARKRFDETGLHATPDEVMQWTDSWGTDKKLPTPVSMRKSS